MGRVFSKKGNTPLPYVGSTDVWEYEQRRIESLLVSEEEKNRLYQDMARHWPDSDVDTLRWKSSPPDEGLCRRCYEWRRYPIGQRHFGFTWWATCRTAECRCEHHKDEVWMASA